MKVIKRINNNAVMCIDSRGREVVTFGKGIAFSIDKETGDLPLSAIERTFYNINEHYIALLDELSPEIVAVASDIIEAAASELAYEVGPGAALALADHISFAFKRYAEAIEVQMPLSYDVGQMYPVEMRAGRYGLRLIEERMGIQLPHSEAAGIALCILNSAISSATRRQDASAFAQDDVIIDAATKIIERGYAITVDRDGYEFARFATHLHYLLDRIHTGDSLALESEAMYAAMRRQSRRATACLDECCAMLEARLGAQISESERLYLLMHIMRVAHPKQR